LSRSANMWTSREDRGNDKISHLEAANRPRPKLIDDACGIHAWYVRGWASAEPSRLQTGTKERVGRIDGCCVDANAHLSGTSMRLGKLEDVQDLWPAECHHPYRFHICFLTSSFSPFIARVAAGIWSASRKECMAWVAASFNAWGAWRWATVATTVRNGRSPAGWAITCAMASATSWGSGGVADRFSAKNGTVNASILA